MLGFLVTGVLWGEHVFRSDNSQWLLVHAMLVLQDVLIHMMPRDIKLPLTRGTHYINHDLLVDRGLSLVDHKIWRKQLSFKTLFNV